MKNNHCPKTLSSVYFLLFLLAAAWPAFADPLITAQPQDVSTNAGKSIKFTADLTGTMPLSNTWYRISNSVAVQVSFSISNNASGSLSSTYTTSASPGVGYFVVSANSVGSVTSRTAMVTVPPAPPTITTQPTNFVTTLGSTASFRVAASGSTPMSYQWFFNGSAVGGATASAYLLTNVTTNNAGSYNVIVTNNYGSATSQTAVMSFRASPPTSTNQTLNIIAAPGTNVTLSINANGDTPMTFQWSFNGGGIGGATTSTLSLTGVTNSDSGSYSVVVTNGSGSITKLIAVLTVANQSFTPSQVTLLYHSVTNGDVLLLSSLQSTMNYTLQDTSNLVDWLNLYSFRNGGGTQLLFTNRHAITNGGLYYRISSP